MSVIDEYEERKGLRRSRGRWRLFALLALIALVAVIALRFEASGPHIARYEVTDVIYSDPTRDDMLREIAENSAVDALLLRINSPGGTVTGSEELYEALRYVADKKPVVATISEVAASGGYIAAIAADQIFTRKTSITGSVGVLYQMPNAHALLDKLGVEVIEVKSGALKAEPAPYKPVSDAAIEAEKILIDDTFAWFRALVRERRSLGDNAMETISDGRVFTGRMAQELGLVDSFGGEAEAIEWLSDEHDIDGDSKIIDYAPHADDLDPISLLTGAVGMDATSFFDRHTKPGMWAVHR